MNYKKLLQSLNFQPKENSSGIFIKKYANNYAIEVDIENQTFHYGGKIKIQGKKSQKITKPEDWVVFECVNRLLEKGYKPENIALEKVYPSGHGTSGRLDICVNREDGSEYLLIECKTYGQEFSKAFNKLTKDGGQLFTYFKFSNKADVIMLYTSELKGSDFIYQTQIIKIEGDYRLGDVKDFYDKWNKLTKDNGVFDDWVNPYQFISKALTPQLLQPIQQEDSSFIFNRFLEILRHNVVSDKPNAFNKIFTLFLCKIYDEKYNEETDNELGFQWLEGVDDDISFQLRLTDLYKNGMFEFLEKKVTDFSETEFENKFKSLDDSVKLALLTEFKKIRLEKNNEFAIKEVYDEKSFKENAKVVKEVVELLQGYKIRYTKKQQYLSDFFELLLTTGLKQESGQFFTPVPIAQFVIKSLPIDKLVEAKLQKGEANNLLPFVMDYAAGSGHFLTETMHEVQRLIDKKDDKKYRSSIATKIKNWKTDHFDWAIDYVYGIEKDYRLVKVGKVGCYLHGDGLANVIHSDGLAYFNHPDYKGKLKIVDKEFKKENKQFEIIVSNPPYSVSSFKNASTDYYKEKDFDLYNRLTDNSSEIECLFIERTKQLLKDGGVAGIILPSSILSNTGIYTKSREIILQYFDIVAITELGSNTFMATGTNTVVLFLRRRNNYDSINIKLAVDKFFSNQKDVTINGIEKPIVKYVSHVWQNITLEDYITLIKKQPNATVQKHEFYIEYKKKLKVKDEAAFWDVVLKKESEKLHYFIIAYPQKVVLVKSGEKDAEKRFLGYEFSNRRGSEGIHPMQRGKNIEDCTQLFDADEFENPTKASTYIYKAFNGDFNFAIDITMQSNVSCHQLVDMLTFDRVDFEKSISLSIKKKIKIDSKWEQTKLDNLNCLLKRGKSSKYGKSAIQIIKSGQARGNKDFDFSEKHYVDAKFQLDERQLQKGDILINSSGVGTAGRVTIFNLDGTYVVDSHITILRPDVKKIIPDYLLQTLSFIGFKNIEAMAMGQSGQIELTLTTIANIQIPLPPLKIQQKIVAEIEVLENWGNKAKENIKEFKNTIAAILDFKVTNTQKLSDYTTLITKGSSPTWQGINYTENEEILFVTSENVREGFLDLSKKKFLEYKFNEIQARSILQKDDVLINIVGASIGRAAIYNLSNPANINQAVALVRCHTSLLNPNFLNFFLNTEKAQSIYNSMKVDVARANLSLQNISDIEIPAISIIEQKKIVAKIRAIEEKMVAIQKSIQAIPQQKESILKKYL